MRAKKILSMLLLTAAFCGFAAPEGEISAMNQQFFKLFRAESQSEKGKNNVLMSPLSVQQVFGMLSLGADGETLQEINEVFGFDSSSAAWFAKTSKSLENQKNMTLFNSIIVDKTFKINDPYVLDVRKYYAGKILWADFSRQAEAAAAINSIIEKHSRGLFKDVLQSNDLSPDTVAVLLNVLYFKAQWRYEFDKNNTHQSSFTAADKTMRLVDMMYQKENLPYFRSENGKFHGVILPYKEARFEMIAVMPTETDGSMDELLGALSDGKLDQWITAASSRQPTKLFLPKLDLENKISLTSLLCRSGLETSFSAARADFKKIGSSAKGNIFLSNVLHMVKIKVDEVGTEGAAVTIAMVEAMAMPMEPPKENIFRADRPFVILLHDRESGAVIFSCLINTLPAVK